MKSTTSLSLIPFFPLLTSASFPTVSCEAGEAHLVDILILGGGASGTYAAVQLQRSGLNVAVVEQQEDLGGHVQTYWDVESSRAVDYGVKQYLPTKPVRDFFDYLGVEYEIDHPRFNLTWLDFPRDRIVYEIFSDKQPTSEPPLEESPLGKYHQQASQYPDLEAGFFLPDSVPEDLLLPFGEYVQRFELQSAVPFLHYGIPNLLDMPTLYVFKTVTASMVQSMHRGLLYTKNRNNKEIFQKAFETLRKSRVYSSSNIISMKRGDGGVSACVSSSTKSGTRSTLFHAKKFLMAVPPQAENMTWLDISSEEQHLFSKFSASQFSVGLVRVPCAPQGSFIFVNINPASRFGLPDMPGVYRIASTEVQGLLIVEYGSVAKIPESQVRSDIVDATRRIQSCSTSNPDPEIVAFANHSPWLHQVPAHEVRVGFYQNLYNLQGQQNTFYTGGAFHTFDSSSLWEFTDHLVKIISMELGNYGTGDVMGNDNNSIVSWGAPGCLRIPAQP